MTDLDKIAGIKKRLRRTHTLAELKAISDKIWSDGATEETIITSLGSEGASSSAVVNLPKAVFLDIVEDLISELEPVRVRQLGTFANFGAVTSPV